jgi:hypothetical protein
VRSRFTEQHSTPGKGLKFEWLSNFALRFSFLVGLLSLAGVAFPREVFANAPDVIPEIRIHVDNYSQASPTTLRAAEREAGRIFGEAGLRIVWLNCPVGSSPSVPQNPCQGPLEPTDIVLRIIPEATKNMFQDSVFGFAVFPLVASVFYDYAARIAKMDAADFEVPILLGCGIAHEIGHLLLGLNSHSDSGIMQRRWERKQIRQAMTGNMLFAPEQAKLIQAAKQARMKLQTAIKERPIQTVDHQVGPKADSAE